MSLKPATLLNYNETVSLDVISKVPCSYKTKNAADSRCEYVVTRITKLDKSDQIGVNQTKSDIPNYQIWTHCPQLHHCIRSTFSLYWIIRITFLSIFLTQPKHMGHLRYENYRDVINKGDDEVR